MNFVVAVLVFVLLSSSSASGQELTREQKLQKISELNNQIKVLEQDVLQPDAKDLKQAEKAGFGVFRILPREKYDGKLVIRGGGSY